MIVAMQEHATEDQIDAIIERTARTLDQTLADPDVRRAMP